MLTSASLTLVLGATGKTGSRVASRLVSRGLPVRTAARSGADAHFDWDDSRTYAPALHGVNRIYLLGPVMRTDFAGQVSVLLDQAEAAGARHVAYLSAYGIDSAPPETAMRSVELDLLGRPGLTHAILRPTWFMQNFSETSSSQPGAPSWFPLVMAERPSSTRRTSRQSRARHWPTRRLKPAPSTHSPVPRRSRSRRQPRSSATSAARLLTTDIDRGEWVADPVAGGVPAEYGAVLSVLTETIASGRGSRPSNDIEKATGAPPTSFADFARRKTAAWAMDETR